MTQRQILTEPNEILRKKSLPLENVDKDLQILMDDMLETMYAAPGIGLAAIQVGIPKRVIVLDIEQKEGEKKPLFFVNPEIIQKSKNLSSCIVTILNRNNFLVILGFSHQVFFQFYFLQDRKVFGL